MSSITQEEAHNHTEQNKRHVVCVPFPAQGHINPMLKLAKLLHRRGFHVTFVHTEYNWSRLVRSLGPESVADRPGFRFEAIPDGLPPPAAGDGGESTQDILSLCCSTNNHCLGPFRRLLAEINDEGKGFVPRVSCVVSDYVMSFAIQAAEEIGVPVAALWTASACGFMGYVHFRQLMERGFVPLKDERCLTNGYLDTVIDWIPGMKGIRLRDLPSFVRTTDPNDFMIEFISIVVAASSRATAVILNTFEPLDRALLQHLATHFPRLYAVGPLHRLVEKAERNDDDALLPSIGSNLWKEENECVEWLDGKKEGSVVYVNFGSITVMSQEQLREFAWGLAKSMRPFVWIIRQDLVSGDLAVLPPDFAAETAGRGVMAGWCAQEKVLSHPAVGGFLTHCGWNSVLESLSAGVPVVCWPFFAEQQTNCWFLCRDWGVGMEIGGEARREEVEMVVRELMDGERGNEMRKKALEWKAKVEEATNPNGSSLTNLDKLVNEILLH